MGHTETEEQKRIGDMLILRKAYNPEKENKLKNKEKDDPLVIRMSS